MDVTRKVNKYEQHIDRYLLVVVEAIYDTDISIEDYSCRSIQSHRDYEHDEIQVIRQNHRIISNNLPVTK
jgi:hypothetical protein